MFRAANLRGDKAAAERVAHRLRAHVEEAADQSDREALVALIDDCIAEELRRGEEESAGASPAVIESPGPSSKRRRLNTPPSKLRRLSTPLSKQPRAPGGSDASTSVGHLGDTTSWLFVVMFARCCCNDSGAIQFF